MIRSAILLLLAAPLIGFILNGIIGRKIIRRHAYPLAMATTLISFVCACILFRYTMKQPQPFEYELFGWIKTGNLNAGFTVWLDGLSALMLIVVSFVGFLIHVYSGAYMQNDPGYHRYFSFLNLFVFCMFMLVLSSNMLMLYVFWEGVGLCSYLLIGFWYEKKSATDAAKKAFIVNRVGDLGFALGLFLLFVSVGTFKIDEALKFAQGLSESRLTLITMLLFLGACGKSAQFPLHIWLPDAMEGPTPVSALIHAATMVTAGVYMIVRASVIFSLAPVTLHIIASIGTLTAILAATMALVQTDLKKILAYSTISQLGYMFMAVGVGAMTTAMFHLTTHAFFKALLFLCAGSVMHATEGRLDVRELGGLSKKMPVTHYTFIIGGLALAGIPPLSGFFSKDEILSKVFAYQAYILWFVGIITAFLTALYTGRAYFLTFRGEFRGNESVYEHCHESPRRMKNTLIVLAVFTFIVGFFGLPLNNSIFMRFLDRHAEILITSHIISHSTEIFLIIISTVVALAGILLAWIIYDKQKLSAIKISVILSPFYKAAYYLYGMDILYQRISERGKNLFEFISTKIDDLFIDRIVDGSGEGIKDIGGIFKKLHSGIISDYIVFMVMGTFFICIYLFLKVYN